jgi:hypothetical protein
VIQITPKSDKNHERHQSETNDSCSMGHVFGQVDPIFAAASEPQAGDSWLLTVGS